MIPIVQKCFCLGGLKKGDKAYEELEKYALWAETEGTGAA